MPVSARVQVQRHDERGAYDLETIHAILDEGLYCHVGFIQDGQPYVIPTLHVRCGNRLYLHGSPLSRMARTLAGGVPVCVTVTLVDGIVLARSGFNSSMNYRSAVVLGTAREVTDRATKIAVLAALIDHVMSGRANDCRLPNPRELRATSVVEVPIDEATAKIRTGPPHDKRGDLALDYWAGVVPLGHCVSDPIPSPDLRSDIGLPSYLDGSGSR